MKLSILLPSIVKKSRKRRGRGYGSGVGGHTVGRGQKGQRSRGKIPLWFEGGQLPLIKRLPMLRGKGKLKSLKTVCQIKLDAINKLEIQDVTLDTLKQLRLIPSRIKQVKILSGKIERKIAVSGILTTQKAKQQIEAAGGTVTQ